MIDATNLLRLKEAEIKKALSKSIGLIIAEKGSVVIVTKSRNPIFFYETPEKNSHLFLWGIAGSDTNGRNFQAEFMAFLSKFRNLFSERDVNIMVARDFIGSYLRTKLYNIRSAEPTALEFILGKVCNDHMVFFTVDYMGNFVTREDEADNVALIGAYGAKTENLLKYIANTAIASLTYEEIQKHFEPQFKEFTGVFYEINFDIKQSPNQAETQTKNKKTKGRK